jgi:hypothetical protein
MVGDILLPGELTKPLGIFYDNVFSKTPGKINGI